MDIKIKELTSKILEDDFPGFIETLSNLRPSNKLTLPKAKQVLKQKKKCNHIVLVAILGKQIAGIVTIIIEPKFIRNAGVSALVEDLITRPGYEGKHIGSKLMNQAIKIAKKNKCYKMVLNSCDYNASFYEKFDFKKEELGMKLYLCRRCD